MATRRIVTTTDDIDGSPGAQRVYFAFGDESYEIDLSESNVSRLREALEPYMQAGRRLSRSGRPYVRINLDEQPHGRRRTRAPAGR